MADWFAIRFSMTDIRRIAFVSAHYLELQGLVPAAFGGAILLAALMHGALAVARSVGAMDVMLWAMLRRCGCGGDAGLAPRRRRPRPPRVRLRDRRRLRPSRSGRVAAIRCR
jgi:hypothetical protein